MNKEQLNNTAKRLVVKGKGILAADESVGTADKRFGALNIPSNEETRRSYRELLFTTRGIEEFLSGIILFDETIRQKTEDGKLFIDLLSEKGILPGIKVDKGTIDLPNFPGEKITEGLDGLRDRLREYYEMGARFAKWRGVITINEDAIPTDACVSANAYVFAQYAAFCQETGLVPIIEPEVLLDGNYSIERSEEVTAAVLKTVFSELKKYNIMLEGILIKSSMVISGKEAPNQADASAVAKATVRALRASVPETVPGVVFLSGGQAPLQATENLNAIALLGSQPWELTFSYSRALQEPVLNAWKGDAKNKEQAQKIFYQRAKCNAAARNGAYSKEMETEIIYSVLKI